MKTEIFILGHKPLEYGYWDNSLYTPLQVGDRERFLPLKDDVDQDNISAWNGIYAETTGTYYISKHLLEGRDFVGQCQYRRRLEFAEDTDFGEIFRYHDVIAAYPLNLGNVYQQYCHCHCRLDMDYATQAVDEKYPDLSDAWRRHIYHGGTLYYSNSFVLPAAEFARYSKFLFDVIDGVAERYGWTTPEKAVETVRRQLETGERNGARGLRYQQQVFGFLSERIWTFWIQHNYATPLLVSYKKYEGV